METKALIADSSAMVRRNIARSLNEIGVRNVMEATDSNQAIELVKKHTFDVAFAEWNTQIGAGEELVQSFRKLDPNMPIIVTAPHTKKFTDLQQNCPSASTYLMVPFTTQQLRKTVSQYVPSIAG
jgi:two-component SAPR family response regulator